MRSVPIRPGGPSAATDANERMASIHSKTLTAIDSSLQRTPAVVLVAASLLLVAILGGVDHLSGSDLSFSIFYIAPIALVAWYGSRRRGLLLSVASALVWLAVDRAGGQEYAHVIVPVWNAVVRFGFFALITVLLASLKAHVEFEQRMARTDELTGLMNRRAFGESAGAVLRLAARHGQPIALACIDLDNFKEVNDASGHAEGDRVLRAVASVMEGYFRSTDLIGRIGGDEFAVLLPHTRGQDAEDRFRELHRRLMQEADARDWPIGFSVGVSSFAQPPGSVDECMQRADAMMYRAKRDGKNRVLIEQIGGDLHQRAPTAGQPEAPLRPTDAEDIARQQGGCGER